MTKERIVSYTKEELAKKRGQTDYNRVRKTTDEEIERQIEEDPDLVKPTDEELKEFRPASERKRKENK